MKKFYLSLFSVCLVLVGVIWMIVGRIAIEKIATSLLMPAGVVWLVLSLLFLESIRLKNRRAIAGTGLVWLIYSLAGNWYLAGYLVDQRESQYADVSPFDQGKFEAVVVLGGGGSEGANGRFQGNGSGDRLILAAQLYHRKQVGKLVCTGKRIESMDSAGVDEAQRALDILTNLGVPREAVEVIGGRNSVEEMEELAKRYGGSGERVGLVTSAWHMPRVERLARSKRFQFTPLPADFVTSPDREPPTFGAIIVSLVPSGDALALSGKMWKETLAGWVRR